MSHESARLRSGDTRRRSGDTQLTLVELAAMVGGRAAGDLDKPITGVTSLVQAGPTDLGLLVDSRYSHSAGESAAGAILVSSDLEGALDPAQSRVVVEDPRRALPTILEHFFEDPLPRPGLHETAVIAEDAELGTGVSVGPYVVIEENVAIGDGTTLHAHVVVRSGARLGRNVTLHPHVVVYPHVQVGDRVVLHAGVRVGVDGFGYTPSENGLLQIPHVGACVIGDDVEIGANSCVDRGSIGHTELEAHVKLDNLVHIAQRYGGSANGHGGAGGDRRIHQGGSRHYVGRAGRRHGSYLRRRRRPYRGADGPDGRRSGGEHDGRVSGSASHGFSQGPGSSVPPGLAPPPCACPRAYARFPGRPRRRRRRSA